ncbi:cupin domain-containing protein [Catenulispora pinisilvae]|uniref:cupin domain-containing protein n=1 Tax=Catenulispora pinisilvae TaxID=2705253 RepID=UPI001891473C|nr:cupin domain-containing protein [Catenulispora pinisilvae]
MPVIRTSENRQAQTPAGTMTTLASPTLGAAERPIWRVDVAATAPAGPLHVIDVEQIWVFTEGGADVTVAGETHAVRAGDTVVVPADAERQVAPDAATGFSAIVTAPVGGRAWVLPRAGDGVVPPWTV